MKTKLLFFMMAAMLFASCGDDDLPNILQYDGENVTGPLLDAGTHEAAVRFPASLLADYDGREMTSVQWFMGGQPDVCKLVIYGQGTSSSPGAKIVDVDVTNGIATPSWNEYTLSDPIVLGGEDIWISIELLHSQTQQSIGCDAGPNRSNGDWLFSSSDSQWLPYTNRTSESINWNIRGIISE